MATAAIAAEPHISGYGGWALDNSEFNYDIDKLYLEPMKKSGFNAIDMKIFSEGYGPQQMEELERLAGKIKQSGLAFHVYATPISHRAGKYGLPAAVDENGKDTVRICLGKYETFRKVYEGAYKIAAVSKKLGIRSVKLDLEWIGSMLPCYCDSCWSDFALANGLSVKIPPEERHALLVSRNLIERYRDAMLGNWEQTAKNYEREMHSIAPSLMLGMMPAENSPTYLPFVKYLAIRNVPAMMDSWCMYGGNGYNAFTRQSLEWIRKQNPDNIPQPWLWVIYYYPESITSQCYGLLKDGIGYTLYPLSAIRLESGNQFPGKAAPELYFKAFSLANRENSERLKLGTAYVEKIHFTPVKALVPECNRELVKQLPLTAFLPEAKPKRISPITLRHQNVFYVEATPGDPLSFSLRHCCGDKVTAIAINIIDPETGELLLADARSSGTEGKVEYTVDRRRILAVILQGGEVGPWYTVMFMNKRFGMLGYRPDDRTGTYFMGKINRDVTLIPKHDAESFVFTLSGGPVEYKLFSPDGFKVSEGRTSLPTHQLSVKTVVPAGTSGRAWRLHLQSPGKMAPGEYIQNCWLNFVSGLEPLFSFSPESMLILKKEK